MLQKITKIYTNVTRYMILLLCYVKKKKKKNIALTP